MQKIILFILVFNTIINAQELVKINTQCTKSKELVITINSDKLNLSQDAVIDNVGGYVDIPEDWYYLKTKTKVYKISGTVDNFNTNNINQFKSIIHTKELYELASHSTITFIQKINLEENNSIENFHTTTNKLDVHFDQNLFLDEYKKCKDQ